LRSVFSELVRQDRVVLVEELAIDAPKTRLLAGKLRDLGLHDVLILNEAFDEKIFLAARNLPHVGVCDAASVDPVVLIRFEKILMTLPALTLIEERLS
jgi:large subunit ribosomal protein L4